MANEKKLSEEQAAMDADITAEERALIDQSIDSGLSRDQESINRAVLDNVDDDGELLEGASTSADFTAEGLDIPGAELDDENEMLGEEDEENNSYSQADTE